MVERESVGQGVIHDSQTVFNRIELGIVHIRVSRYERNQSLHLAPWYVKRFDSTHPMLKRLMMKERCLSEGTEARNSRLTRTEAIETVFTP